MHEKQTRYCQILDSSIRKVSEIVQPRATPDKDNGTIEASCQCTDEGTNIS